MHSMECHDFDVVPERKIQSVGQRMDTSDEGSLTDSKRPSFPPVSAQQAGGVGGCASAARSSRTCTPLVISSSSVLGASLLPCMPSPVVQGRVEVRRVPVPPHRYTPLKDNWMKIFTPIVEQLKLQIRLNLKSRSVELRVRSPAWGRGGRCNAGLMSTAKCIVTPSSIAPVF